MNEEQIESIAEREALQQVRDKVIAALKAHGSDVPELLTQAMVIIDSVPTWRSEVKGWIEHGDALMARMESGQGGFFLAIGFGIGQWWADRPWRKR